MAPAILITIGIVFLSDRHAYLVPAILIVIGLVKVLQSNAPTEGHVNPPLVAVAAVPMQQPFPSPAPPVQSPTTSDPSAAANQEENYG